MENNWFWGEYSTIKSKDILQNHDPVYTAKTIPQYTKQYTVRGKTIY